MVKRKTISIKGIFLLVFWKKGKKIMRLLYLYGMNESQLYTLLVLLNYKLLNKMFLIIQE